MSSVCVGKRRRPTIRGDGLTERKFELEELVHPVSREEIEEFEAGQADYSADRLVAVLETPVQAARQRLEELARDPPANAFKPYLGDGWYCQKLVDLADKIGRFADEWEVASDALLDAIAFGELAAEFRIRREHNEFFKNRWTTYERQSDSGSSRRKRPRDDQSTLNRWDHFFALSGKKTLADEETAAAVGVSASTIRALRNRCRR